ncbi:MAG: hypothetical protein LBS38_03270 [Endomicrobium sp.]|nr:hypothetical protein [Endomicrobium sp.]
METLNTVAPRQKKFNRRNAAPYKKQERSASEPAKDEQTVGAKIVQTSTHVQISFPSKPSEAIRSALKASYFKWYPKLSCWQRLKGWQTLNVAKELLQRYRIQPA